MVSSAFLMNLWGFLVLGLLVGILSVGVLQYNKSVSLYNVLTHTAEVGPAKP